MHAIFSTEARWQLSRCDSSARVARRFVPKPTSEADGDSACCSARHDWLRRSPSRHFKYSSSGGLISFAISGSAMLPAVIRNTPVSIFAGTFWPWRWFTIVITQS